MGIPGWRLELIEALLKSLPKDKRRSLVPIPDTAKSWQPVLMQSIYVSIFSVFWLSSCVASRLQKKIFSLDRVEQYLLPLIKVIDEKVV